MSEWVYRLAEPKDAEAFSVWSATNQQIDQKDLISALKKNNPTVLYFVAEKDGVPIAFAPVYLVAKLAHLGLNPEACGTDKMHALQVLTDGTVAFMAQYGVREIQTLSKPEYAMAQWAVRHGFEQEDRQIFALDVNKILEQAEEESTAMKV